MLLYDAVPDPVKPVVAAAALATAALLVSRRRRGGYMAVKAGGDFTGGIRVFFRLGTWFPGGFRELVAAAAAFAAYAAALYVILYMLRGALLIGDDAPYYYAQLSFMVKRHRLYWRDAPAAYLLLAALYYLLGGDGFLAVEALHVIVLAALPLSTYIAARMVGRDTLVSVAAASTTVFLPGYFYLVVNAGGNYKQGLGTVLLIPAVAASARLRELHSPVLRSVVPASLLAGLLAVHVVAAYAYLPVLLLVLAETLTETYRRNRLMATVLAAAYASAVLAAAAALPSIYVSKAVHGPGYMAYLYRAFLGLGAYPLWLSGLLFSTAVGFFATALLYRRGYYAAAYAMASASAALSASFFVGQPYIYGLRSPYYRFVSVALSLAPFIVFSSASRPLRGVAGVSLFLLSLATLSVAAPVATPAMYTGVVVRRTPCIDELSGVARLVSMDDLVFVADDIPVRFIFLGMAADKTYKVYYASPLLLRQDTYRMLIINKDKYDYSSAAQWYMETHRATVIHNGSCYIVLYIRGLRR